MSESLKPYKAWVQVMDEWDQIFIEKFTVYAYDREDAIIEAGFEGSVINVEEGYFEE